MYSSAQGEVFALRKAGTAYRNLSLGVTGQVIKASAGEVAFLHVGNAHATAAAYLKLYNKATAPTDADTPLYTFFLPANTAQVIVDVRSLEGFTAGISARATKLSADNDTTAPDGAIIVSMGTIASG